MTMVTNITSTAVSYANSTLEITVYVVILRWFYFREFRESDLAKISTLVYVYL